MSPPTRSTKVDEKKAERNSTLVGLISGSGSGELCLTSRRHGTTTLYPEQVIC